MSSSLSDPDYHVPEGTPGDEWGDATGAGSDANPAQAILPRRRSVMDKEASLTHAPERIARAVREDGLRIEPRVSRTVESDEPVRLEVQEFAAQVIRLEQEIPALPKVERLTKFHERAARDEDDEPITGESREWGKARRHPLRWIFIMAASVALLIAAAFLALTSINQRDDLDGQASGVYSGNLPDGSPYGAFLILEGDRLVLDWKATTGYGSARFSELEAGVGDAREIRGRLQPHGYYNATWPEADYQSYILNSPNGTDCIWLYARRGSDIEAAIRQMLLGGQIIRECLASVGVTVHLVHGPDGSLPNQWQIQDVLRFHWLNC